MSYVTAYFKANYPAEWMAALMTSDRDDLSKVAKVIRECQSMGIAILTPDINESGKAFFPTERGIRFAMSGIKGVGEGVVEGIFEERKKNGAFKDLYDFICRIDTRKIGKKVIEYLIESGCFDFTGWSRSELLASVEPMFNTAAKEQKDASKGIVSLFSLIEDKEQPPFRLPPQVQEEIPRQKLLKREYELLGFYLNGHPLDDYRFLLPKLSCVPFKEIEHLPNGSVARIACIIESVAIKISAKSQKKFAILVISDGIERFELPVWSELYEEKGALLAENQLLYVVVQLEKQEGELKFQCRFLTDLTCVDETVMRSCDEAFDKAKTQTKLWEKKPKPKSAAQPKETAMSKHSKLRIAFDIDRMKMSHILELKKIFRSHAGKIPVQVLFIGKTQMISSVHIDANWGVEHSYGIEERLRKIQGLTELIWDS
ncbi:MAG: hypothetical protein HYZ48_00070 [Chlamydiales bacterium]|nr:hypothetical protein [Chlamydiales bacterium]